MFDLSLDQNHFYLILSTLLGLLCLGLSYLYMRKKMQLLLEIKDKDMQITQLQAELAHEKKLGQEYLTNIASLEKRFEDAFSSLSAKALRESNQSFLQLLETVFVRIEKEAHSAIDQKEKTLTGLMLPLQDALTKVQQKIDELEKKRLGAYEGMEKQISSLIALQADLRKQTTDLVQALRSPVARGRWGEIQLKRVVEMAGMIEHCDFVQQPTVDNAGLRPDLVVHLPSDKCLVVDAKTPLAAYLSAIETNDETLKRQFLSEHAQHVRKHIQELSAKSYWAQFENAPEFVVMFLPGEPFFSAALEQDPSLIEFGVDKKVILATPTTLIALLRSVAYGWKQASLAENAREVSELGKQLYERLADLSGHFADLGNKLDAAVGSYNKAIGTLERRVLVTARKFNELNMADGAKQIKNLSSIEKQHRVLQAEELNPESQHLQDLKS